MGSISSCYSTAHTELYGQSTLCKIQRHADCQVTKFVADKQAKQKELSDSVTKFVEAQQKVPSKLCIRFSNELRKLMKLLNALALSVQPSKNSDPRSSKRTRKSPKLPKCLETSWSARSTPTPAVSPSESWRFISLLKVCRFSHHFLSYVQIAVKNSRPLSKSSKNSFLVGQKPGKQILPSILVR